MNDFKLVPTDKKDHYRLMANGVDAFGEHETSTWKHLIQELDNGIHH